MLLSAFWVLPACEKRSGASASESTHAAPAEGPAPENKLETSRDDTRPLPEGGLCFMAYNVENWLTMERFDNRVSLGKKPKPGKEKKAVIRMLSGQRPDVVGLCEIGTREDLQEIQSMLRDAGVSLPHLHHSTGTDGVRSLGLLSRHPIIATQQPQPLEYRLNGRTFGMGRGILDATVDAAGTRMRFLGVHLKSKREVEEGDQAAMRLHEARLLRQHVDDILRKNPNEALVVYGDFNDTYPSPTVRTITSHSDRALRLKPLYLRDSRREAWTHHWAPHDIYSRIDFVTLSPSVADRADHKASGIVDDPLWEEASDHRPLRVIFR